MRNFAFFAICLGICTSINAEELPFKKALLSGNRHVSITMPDYPPNAFKNGIGGRVLFEFSLDNRGEPKNVAIIESEPSGVFDEAVKAAISSWRYLPNMALPCSVSERRSRQQLWFEIENGEPRISMSKVIDVPELEPVLQPTPELGKGAFIEPGNKDDNRLVLVKNSGLQFKDKAAMEIRYPKAALEKGLQGIVVINFTIKADGKTADPKITYSIPYRTFDTTVLNSVTNFEFETKEGKPPGRNFRVCQEFNFLLRD